MTIKKAIFSKLSLTFIYYAKANDLSVVEELFRLYDICVRVQHFLSMQQYKISSKNSFRIVNLHPTFFEDTHYDCHISFQKECIQKEIIHIFFTRPAYLA